MKFSFPVPHMLRLKAISQPWEATVTGPEQRRMMRCADQWGYDMIAVPEHLIIPTDHVELSGPHYLHSTVAQAFIAGATERVAVNSCITILPLQHPIVLAKALATADWMSGGRMMVTFGVGWLAREFELVGVPFAERGRIADEYLAAIVELWTSDAPTFEGRYVSFADIAFEPKPVQNLISRSGSAATPTPRCAGPPPLVRAGGRSNQARADRRKAGLHQVPTLL